MIYTKEKLEELNRITRLKNNQFGNWNKASESYWNYACYWRNRVSYYT
jgi:hypothetical protein